jgi:hypothetical protein
MKRCSAATSKPEEAAAILGIVVKTLQNWRVLRVGPSFYRIGGAVRCSPEKLER